MMHQSSALRRLEIILHEAVTHGNGNEVAGPLLMKTMGLAELPQNLVDLYVLIDQAQVEATRIKNIPRIDRYLQSLDSLKQVFVVRHVWREYWQTFAQHIESGSILATLDALANYFYLQTQTMALEESFLRRLNAEFELLFNEVLYSSLSTDFKGYLTDQLEGILRSIRRYSIDGTEGLEQAVQLMIARLVMIEHRFKDEDKKNPLYTRIKAWVMSVSLYLSLSSEMSSIISDMNAFWIPKFEELSTGREKLEQIIWETSTIQEAFARAAHLFNRQPQRWLAGIGEPKELPAFNVEVVPEN